MPRDKRMLLQRVTVWLFHLVEFDVSTAVVEVSDAPMAARVDGVGCAALSQLPAWASPICQVTVYSHRMPNQPLSVRSGHGTRGVGIAMLYVWSV